MTDTLIIPSVIESPIDIFGDAVKDSPENDSEPRRNARSGKPTGRRAKPQQRRTQWAAAADVEKALTESIQFLAGGAMLVPALEPDASLLYDHGPNIVHELVELGRSDKRLRVFLERLAAPGKYGPLAVAIFPLVLGIATNHGLVPNFLGNRVGAHADGGEFV